VAYATHNTLKPVSENAEILSNAEILGSNHIWEHGCLSVVCCQVEVSGSG
jgi:hypothetical protein